MAIGQISLTAAARANLLALQNTSKLLGLTQQHLSTGKKVNSALDNAASYFASQGFLNSANDLDSLKDSMATALQTLKAASDGISAITKVVQQLQGIANSAAQSQDNDTRAGLAAQYNALLSQLDALANDSTFNGTNLLNSLTAELKVVFNAEGTTYLTVSSNNVKSNGLGLGQAVGNFAVGQRAKHVTATLTRGNDTNMTSQVYSGTISGISMTGASSTTGNGTVLTSNSSDFSNGATIESANAALYTNIDTALGAYQTNDVTGGATSGTLSIVVNGQFTATGGSASSFVSATEVLTAGATDSTGITISVGAGQSIQVVYDTGVGNSNVHTYTYTNTSANAITFYMGNAADTVTAKAVNSTAAYYLSAGTVANLANLSMSNSGTYAGNLLVDSQSVAVGGSVTTHSTSAVSSTTDLGTTTQSSISAYDVGSATITGIQISDIRATTTDGGTATYSATNAHVTATGIKTFTGSSVTVVADAITTAQNELSNALKTLRTVAASIGNNNTLVQTRQDFTNNLVSTLQTASDNLVLADTNEEGANMQALQAQSQLGIVSLGISGQLAQAILKLF